LIVGVRTQDESPPISTSGEELDKSALEARFAEAMQLRGAGPQTDAQGVARIPWVMPGKRSVYVAAQSYSAFSGRLEIEGGGTCERRAIELNGQARISGRVFDPQGTPGQARLR